MAVNEIPRAQDDLFAPGLTPRQKYAALVIGREGLAPLLQYELVVFLAHMPVYYALTPVLTSLGLGYWPRALVQFVIGLFGLALLSEAIRAVLPALPVYRRVSLGFSYESR